MRTQRGFSLLEILFAFAVLMIVITISLGAFLERNKRLRQADELIRAYQVLANEAEVWRRIDYHSVHAVKSFSSDTMVLEPLEPFSTNVEVARVKPWQKNVTLIIRWHRGEREAKLGLVRVDTGGTNLW
jgi:type II secretory pathway pseudopilin PulG